MSSLKLWLLSPKLPQELDGIVNDLNTTQDGESSKKPHGSSDKTQGGLQGHTAEMRPYENPWPYNVKTVFNKYLGNGRSN